MKSTLLALLAFALASTLCTNYFHSEEVGKIRKKPKAASSGMALTSWYAQRSFPGKKINMGAISDGFRKMKQVASRSNSSLPGNWECIGPMNFGGRTLALCFNPQNPNTMYAGSASGGLWISHSGGTGPNAWSQVETGFPVLGIAAIAINPSDTNEIYVGTGEVYNDQNTGTGFAVRTTRGTYGIGILKSTDGGITWSKSLDWQYDELKGVQHLLINPVCPATVFAATTEGTYRSFDSGQNWVLIQNSRMASDIVMIPCDTSKILVAAGNSFSPNSGIFRSVNGGNSFVQITNGIPTYSGKAMLDVCSSSPQIVYASIAEQLSGLGLFASGDGGVSWYNANTTDYQTYQGWYAHDVAVNPGNSNQLMTCGIDTYKSNDGGMTLDQKSFWYNWDFNNTSIGGPEGPPDYVHADIHRMYYHPTNNNIIYFATDGGIFRSLDGGEQFVSCNGGYHTQQFYANFSNSSSDSLFAIGGMQDNATAVYEGNPGWRRVIGGDGLSTAINPNNDQIVYGSSQYLNVEQSFDKAQSFNSLNIPASTATNFAGPFVLAPSNPDIIYAANDIVYKSMDEGANFNPTNNNNVLDGNAVLVLEISDTDPNLVYAATAPFLIPQVGLFKTSNGGTSWTNVTAGIPNRYIMDIAIDPTNNNKVFVALSGFGTAHLFRTVDGGASWSSIGTGLPDVPANTITIDPLNPLIIYLGNDLGVYVSLDGGQNWQPFNDGLIDATFIMDISISPLNRKLRLATHGKGVYERNMLPVSITSVQESSTLDFTLSPNPATDFLFLSIPQFKAISEIKIIDSNGKIVREFNCTDKISKVDVSKLQSGIYFMVVSSAGKTKSLKFMKI